MENAMTISKTREDAKLILKNMPKALQAACDKIFIAGADLGGAIINKNERDSAFRLALLDASNTFGKPDKNSSYKGFGEFACAVFGFKSEQGVTHAVKVAEFIDVPQIPKLGAWYSTDQLYELRSVDSETLKADIANGKLRAGMTTKELREYNNAHKLDDGKAELIPMFTAHITGNDGNTHSFDGTLDEIRAEMVNALDVDAAVESDRFGTFNPHATELRGKKQINGKGLVVVFGLRVVTCVYFPVERNKQTPTQATVEAQNATIAELTKRIAELEAKQG